MNLGFITDNTILDLELTAMETSGNGEVISQPKVVTSDKETAKILKGTEVPYQEASSSGLLFQILSAYSPIVRSAENGPIAATLRRAMTDQASLLW